MAIDKLINQSQGDDIIDALEAIATNVGGITYGPETSSDKVVSMTGYQKASTAAAISQGDTLNEAVGKLEKKVDDNITTLADKVESHSSETTAGNIATYYNATGTEIDDSGVAIVTTVDDTKDTEVPTSKAMGTYVSGLGYATGVNSSTADNLVTFNSTDGKALKDSGIAVATSTTGVVASADNAVPTSKSVANYVSAQNYAVGADSSVANNLVTFNDATGKALKNSGVAIATSTTGITDADGYVPTSKAVKAYVDSTATGISRYMGTVTATSGLSTSAKKGDFYIVSTAWTGVHVGDEIIAEKDNPAQTIDGTNWTLLHNEADTDTKVTQTETSTNASYEVIFAGSTGSSDKTEGVGKDAGMTYNPSTNALTVTGPISAGSFAGNAVKTNWTGTIDNTTVPGTKLVDDRLTTAETNILYTLNTGANNLLDLSNATMVADSSLTVTKDGNSYVVSGNPSTSAQVTFTDFVPCVPITGGKIAVVGCPSGGSTQNGYSLRGYLDNLWKSTDSGLDTKEFTTSSINKIVLYFVGGHQYTNVRFTPMVVSEEVWNTLGSDYRPPALPNSDLTYLEAEDRAELMELVDSGAKNLLDMSSISDSRIYSSDAITLTRNAANEFTVTRAASPTSVQEVKIPLPTSLPINTPLILSGCPSGGTYATYSVEIWENNVGVGEYDYGSGSVPYTFTTTTGRYLRIRFGANTSFSNLKFKFMFSTKAAFGVSKAFVPYRPNYDLVCNSIMKRKSVQYIPHTLTWNQSMYGKYYSADIEVSDISNVYAVTLNHFRGLRDTDIIEPAISQDGTKIRFFSNVNTFTDTSIDEIGVVVIGL